MTWGSQQSNERLRTQGPQRRGRLGITVVICVLVALALGVAQTPPGKSLLSSIGLYAQSQPYTELYFGDTSAIAQATRGELAHTAAAHLSFVIVNRTHRRRRYRWSIDSLGVSRAIGSTTISPGGSRWTSRRITTGCRRVSGSSPERVRITVAIADPAQTINYWLVCHD